MNDPQQEKHLKYSLRLYPMGDSAIIIQFGDTINIKTHLVIQAAVTYLSQHPFPGLIEYVPAYTSLTVYYNPWIVNQNGSLNPYETVAEIMRNMMLWLKTRRKNASFKIVDIPVCYGGILGPDLEFVAAYNKLTTNEVINLHTAPDYLVYMIGFAPGFPYLGGMNGQIATPRKEKPRTKVQAGSVGIAGLQTGIYSISVSGGWQIIGRTPLLLFNPHRQSPSLLKAGDYIRFVPISEEEYQLQKEALNES